MFFSLLFGIPNGLSPTLKVVFLLAETITLESGTVIPNFKTRTFLFILYPDHNPRHKAALPRLATSYQFLGILHDRDVEEDPETGEAKPKRNHYHCIVKFRSQRWLSAVSEELDLEPNLFEDCKNFDGYARYMLHLDDPDKAPYEFSEMFGSLKPLAEKACIGEESESDRILRIIEILDSFACEVTMQQFVATVAKAGLYSDCRRAGYLIGKMVAEHNREVRCGSPFQ